MVMRYLSVCSGIEAASVAWHRLGWSPVAFSEIEAFPSAVLRTHYPDVPNWGDMTKFQEWPNAAIDLLVGGTPCQSFSVAGLRKGLADPRGNLALTYLAIAHKYRPRWVVWENVPGVLSSAGGRDFGAFLGGLGQLGYGWAYRVLDAQYFGVAQRRRRVFVVGCLGSWQRAAAVLFEQHSLSGHPAPSREAGKGPSPRTSGRAAISSGRGYWNESNVGATLRSQSCVTKADTLISQVASCLETTTHDYSRADGFTMIAHSLRGEGFDASEDGTGRGTPVVPVRAFDARQSDVVQYGDLTGPLDTDGHSVGLLIGGIDYENNAHAADEPTGPLLKGSPTGGGRPLPAVAIRTANTGANGHGVSLDVAHTLDQAQGQAVALPAMSVRRLTPRECERLQGFPDDYTLIPYRGKPAADGPRYKALGNSMAVPVMRWIGQRIQEVDRVKR